MLCTTSREQSPSPFPVRIFKPSCRWGYVAACVLRHAHPSTNGVVVSPGVVGYVHTGFARAHVSFRPPLGSLSAITITVVNHTSADRSCRNYTSSQYLVGVTQQTYHEFAGCCASQQYYIIDGSPYNNVIVFILFSIHQRECFLFFCFFFRFNQQAASIEAKIKKICEAFRAKRYDLPEMDDGEGVKKLMYDNYGEMHDARVVLLKVSIYRMSIAVFSGIFSGCD